MKETITSHCHYCMCLCGIKVTREDDKILSIEPDKENPFSWRDFCRKGKTAMEVRDHPMRITTPMKRVGDKYVPATYEEATLDIATKLNAIIDKYGADAVGTYHGNPLGFSFSNSMFFGGLLDALGTGNRYWVGSIDENNQHVVQEEMFGSEIISIPPDIDKCKCFLLIGMDPAQSKFGWMEVIPDGWNRVLHAQSNGSDLIIVDPRLSDSALSADTHIAVLPGQDWAFLLALLQVIFSEGLDIQDTAVPLSDVQTIKKLALEPDLNNLSERCGISVEQIKDVARRFATASSAVCVLHTGVSHTKTGTIAEWLGQVLNAVTNRLDVPGGKRFEKSYVDLAAVFEKFAPPSKHRTRLRDLPTIAGFHSLSELADEITTPGKGQIRAMIIAGGNPVVSGPDSNALDQAFSELDFSVAIDLVQRESHRHADWLIPGTHWLEREGLHVLIAALMDAPFAQYAKQSIPPPEGVKEEWEFFIDLALAMKKPLFGKKGVNTFTRMSRALARWRKNPNLAMNPRWLEYLMVASGKTIKYNEIKKHPHGFMYGEKEYGNLTEALRTSDKTVHCAPPRFIAEARRLLANNDKITSSEFPFILVNRRSRESMNSWLNENQGLFQNHRGNAVEICSDDADNLGLIEGLPAKVTSTAGSIVLPVKIVNGGRRGVVTIPHGWGSRMFDPTSNKKEQIHGVNRNILVPRHSMDPLSQIASFNEVSVRVEAVDTQSTRIEKINIQEVI